MDKTACGNLSSTVTLLVSNLGWLDLNVPLDSAWANGSVAEMAGQPSKMMEHLNQSQPNPGVRGKTFDKTLRLAQCRSLYNSNMCFY